MKKIEVKVRIKPQTLVRWPDGRAASFTPEELGQLLTMLVIERALLLDQGVGGTILEGEEIELVSDEEGRFILRHASQPKGTTLTK